MRLFRSFLVVAVLALGCASLNGCGPAKPQFESVDITGADYAQNFHLTDASGKPRSLADYRGKVVVMFFGYTQCPDVCPTTMAELKTVMQSLGKDADRVQVLFVTLDPARDTPALLAQYVPAFDSRFVGLYGDETTTVQTAKDFKVFFQRVPGPTPTSYTLDHTAGSYVFDPAGHIRLFLRQGQTADAVTHDLRLLLS
ncbi:MAG: SCO family protein [Burkholderiaceae bacterium]